MAKLIEVRDQIKSDDVFFLARNTLTGNLLPGQEIKEYSEFSCTGYDVQQYILSFQTTFLDVIKADVKDLSERYTTYIADLVSLKLLHAEHYETQTEELNVLESKKNTNTTLRNENYRTYEYLEVEKYRKTRIYHVVPPQFVEAEIPPGAIQLYCEDDKAQTYGNVSKIRANRVDLTGEERNFWAVYPGDLLEIVGQQVVLPDDPDGRVETPVKYRAIYRVNDDFNIVDILDDPIMNIPVTLKSSNTEDIVYSYLDDAPPGNASGNVVDYVYGQFSIFPTLDINRYQELLDVYRDFVMTSPIGSCIAWLENNVYKSTTFIESYGNWEVKNIQGYYLVGQGKVETGYEFNSLDHSYNTINTRKPNKFTGYSSEVSNHNHTVTVANGGSHKHKVGSKDVCGGAYPKQVQSAKCQLPTCSRHTTNKSTYSNPEFDRGQPPGPNNKKTLTTHTHPISMNSNGSHTHTDGFKNGWDSYNRMYSHTCHWLIKKEHPQYIKDIREKLAGWYGDDFDRDYT